VAKQRDLDLRLPLDHVIVGDEVTLLADDEAAAHAAGTLDDQHRVAMPLDELLHVGRLQAARAKHVVLPAGLDLVGRLVASDAQDKDQLGISVALDGDRALVGSWRDDDLGHASEMRSTTSAVKSP